MRHQEDAGALAAAAAQQPDAEDRPSRQIESALEAGRDRLDLAPQPLPRQAGEVALAEDRRRPG